jgi:hypothetical protein
LCLCHSVPLSLKLSAAADSGLNHFLDTGTVIYYMIGKMSNPCKGKGEQRCAEKNLKCLMRVESKRS